MSLLIRFATLALLLAVGCAHAGDPVARVRVSFDRHGETSVHTEGLADIGAQRALSADDPARIASISKLVTTIGAMRLVEAGQLNLDADVSGLLGFSLRNPAFPQVPITLRMLLSHTSSLTDRAGYWNVPLGQDIRSITGKPEAWDSQHAPGTYFRYTNLNFPLVAMAQEWPRRCRLSAIVSARCLSLNTGTTFPVRSNSFTTSPNNRFFGYTVAPASVFG